MNAMSVSMWIATAAEQAAKGTEPSEEEVERAVAAMKPLFHGFVEPYLREGHFSFDAALEQMARAALTKARRG